MTRPLPALIFEILTVSALGLLGGPLQADDASPLRYTISFPDAVRHRADITLEVETGGAERIELVMAVWTPGSYLVREYARHVETISARDERDRPLTVRKTVKNRWTVETGGASEITVNYRLYCREMSVRTNWVERDFAVLNGAPTFITVAGRESSPHRIEIRPSADWERSVTALPRADGPHAYLARDYDHLVDSPVLLGNPEVLEFEAGGRPHLLVHEGGGAIWDGEKTREDVRKIVLEHQRLWGEIPYERYVFLNLISEARGGLEHDDSTLLMTSRWSFRVRKSYLSWLSLVSHEFYHTWNVRRLRPAELKTYDYERENYFPTLWVAEGVTSYYDDLVLARARVCEKAEYLERLSSNIKSVQAGPGRLVQSLHAASHDTWVKFYRPDENSVNSAVNYYTKGAVVAFLLDAKLRAATGGARSLDVVMRLLWERHRESGYRPADFRAIASEVAGLDLDAWFREHVDRAVELDYTPALEWLGLEFKPSKPPAKPGAKGSSDEKKPPKKKVWLGASTRDRSGRLLVTRVLAGSPADAAGVNVDDEIIAIDRFRLGASSLDARLGQYAPGDRVLLTVARRERLIDLRLELVEAPAETWLLQPREQATDAQKRHLADWLRLRQEF